MTIIGSGSGNTGSWSGGGDDTTGEDVFCLTECDVQEGGISSRVISAYSLQLARSNALIRLL